MERRAEAAAEEWRKAKAVWRRFAVVLIGLAFLVAFAFAYIAGDANGRFSCACNRPEQDSTP